jgi:hypothetical protein
MASSPFDELAIVDDGMRRIVLSSSVEALAAMGCAWFESSDDFLTRMVCHTSLLRHCVIPGALPRHSCY